MIFFFSILRIGYQFADRNTKKISNFGKGNIRRIISYCFPVRHI